jgi:hypothetical protein
MHESEIKRIYRDPNLSQNFKHRNSVRLFAKIDLGRKIMEINALHNKGVHSHQVRNAVMNRKRDGTKRAERLLALMKEDFHMGEFLYRELAHLHWQVQAERLLAVGRCFSAGTRGLVSTVRTAGICSNGRAGLESH